MAKKKTPKRNMRGYYPIGKEYYVSVTTFLRIINKSFLYLWYANMERKGIVRILDKVDEQGNKLKGAVLRQLLFNFCHKDRVAADRYIIKRGDAGSEIHKAIQRYLSTGKKSKLTKKNSRKAFRNFLAWWPTSGYRAIKLEDVVFDKKLKAAGQLDIYLERIKDKKKGIGDWKTGKNIYLENYLQNVLYRHLGRKTHPSEFGVIFHIPQDGGPITEHKVDEKKYPLSMGVHALELWRDVNER